MNNRNVEEKEYRTSRVTIQVSVNEKLMITNLAKREGLSVSDYIRKKCIYDKINELING